MINSILSSGFILWLALYLELINDGLELLEFPIIHICTTFLLLCEKELSEFGGIVAGLDHLLPQKLLLDALLFVTMSLVELLVRQFLLVGLLRQLTRVMPKVIFIFLLHLLRHCLGLPLLILRFTVS